MCVCVRVRGGVCECVCVLVMGDIKILVYDNHHLKYHGYCKYHDTSKLVITEHKH